MKEKETYCKRCGEKYNWMDQDIPENASIYWVPTCPICRSKETDTPVDSIWIEVTSSGPTDINTERVHKHARLYHGRLAGISREELIERAKWFDEMQRHSKYSRNKYHNIAFKLRKQAREK